MIIGFLIISRISLANVLISSKGKTWLKINTKSINKIIVFINNIFIVVLNVLLLYKRGGPTNLTDYLIFFYKKMSTHFNIFTLALLVENRLKQTCREDIWDKVNYKIFYFYYCGITGN